MTGNFICDKCIGQELPFSCLTHDDEIINAIIEYQQIPIKLMLEKLNKLLFDPLEMIFVILMMKIINTYAII